MPTVPYARQTIEDDDIDAVSAALRSDWLTTGPRVPAFETAFASYCGAVHAVAVNSGTAALHAAMHALGLRPGDEVIVPSITFAATANCVVYQGATPVFAEVDPRTLLLDVEDARRRITPRTKAIVAVDFAGQPAEWNAIAALATAHGLATVADAAHSAGASYRGRPVGTLATLSAFSFHAVKNLTTAEGGMVTTDDAKLAATGRRFRNHGIDSDGRERAERGTHAYDVAALGYNYRLSDIQCALGLSQLRRIDLWQARRHHLAQVYDAAFASVPFVQPLRTEADRVHARHLYVVELDARQLGMDRDEAFRRLRSAGIGVNVHYAPVHLMTLYRERFGCREGTLPRSEAIARRIITLPLFPALSDDDQARVIEAVRTLAR